MLHPILQWHQMFSAEVPPITAANIEFNLVEGIIHHQILDIHRVRPGPHQLA
jgi:uncharacterized membrane protein